MWENDIASACRRKMCIRDSYDIAWLNAYHKEVYDKVSPYLNEAEKEWLKYATREI